MKTTDDLSTLLLGLGFSQATTPSGRAIMLRVDAGSGTTAAADLEGGTIVCSVGRHGRRIRFCQRHRGAAVAKMLRQLDEWARIGPAAAAHRALVAAPDYEFTSN